MPVPGWGSLPRHVGGPLPYSPITAESRAGRRAYSAQYRKTHRDSIRTHNTEYARERRNGRRELIAKLKAHPCMDCGGSFPPECMDFDHRPGEEKSFNVSQVNGRSVAVLMAEVAKCDLVCANCHRTRTVRRQRG